MAATIVVTPEGLRQTAVAVRALGGRLLQVRGELGATVAGLDVAFGGGAARVAFAELWARWSGSAERLARAATELAVALEAAADGYERADQGSLLSPGASAAVAAVGASAVGASSAVATAVGASSARGWR